MTRLNEYWRAIPAVAWRIAAILTAIAIVVLCSRNWNRWEGNRGWQSTDDAYLQADVTPIAAKVGGYVRVINFEDYQRVGKGDVLLEIIDDDYRASVSQANASVTSGEAQLLALDAQVALQSANIDAANAVVAATRANVEQNEKDVARQQVLFRTGSSSMEAAERLQTTHAQLAAQLSQHRALAAAALRQLGVLSAQKTQSRASIAVLKAQLELATINLNYTRIVAPRDGVVGQRQIKPGQYVSVGSQITTLSPLPDVWVIANYKETQLTHMAVGNDAEITVDSFPGRALHGHLLAFAPASGAQFALLPPDNATGNFTKVVQRVSVKIRIDDSDGLADRLLPGMSVVARVHAVRGD